MPKERLQGSFFLQALFKVSHYGELITPGIRLIKQKYHFLAIESLLINLLSSHRITNFGKWQIMSIQQKNKNNALLGYYNNFDCTVWRNQQKMHIDASFYIYCSHVYLQ